MRTTRFRFRVVLARFVHGPFQFSPGGRPGQSAGRPRGKPGEPTGRHSGRTGPPVGEFPRGRDLPRRALGCLYGGAA